MGVHAVRAAARCGSPRRFGSGGGGGYRVVAALWFGWLRRLGWGGRGDSVSVHLQPRVVLRTFIEVPGLCV
jgi:hypothetical protein